ncbi:SCY1-like protein 2 [Trichogramma pretiosum]|uniref:SCY1-like protein 2 n=1 Tax=Trichogramma pretiosum TaxID=7493 RepID=UPI0006C9995A|nr:SCY1-like protein 2 [Trichogramma pretiosum]
MDVFNKLRNTVTNTLSNTVSNTAHSLSQLSSVLPGNPVTREYEVTAHICSAGPGLLWKVYSGFKKSTKQKAAIFVFEKRLLDQWPDRAVRDNVIETLKKGIVQLTKLRHPQILTVQHPLEESRDSLAFATEPVFASLANILGDVDSLPQSARAVLQDYKLLDLEMKFGIYQLGESLAFLHNDVKMLHRNLNPENIVVNDNGDWKIFGFEFCAMNKSLDDKPSWINVDYTSSSLGIKPPIHYQAPECIKSTIISPSSDIFSLGILICYLHAPNNPLWNSRNDSSNYVRFLEELKNIITSARNFDLPNSLKDTVKLMLHGDPELRPDAFQIVKIEYFNDIGVKTLIYLDKLFQWDNLQKSQFYKGLPQILKQFPRRAILQKVLPALQKEFVNAPMIPFLLPSILQVMEECTTEEFNERVLPMLKQIIVIEEPPQISLLLLQKMELLLKWCSPDIVKNYILPMMTRALDSKLEQLQEHCLIAIPLIVKIVDSSSMKNSVIPRMKKICLSGKSGHYSLGVRVNCLLCLSKIIENLDSWIVREEILPFLLQIPNTGEPAILVAAIGIFKLILVNSKLGISKDLLATKVLPFLLPLCVEQSFNPKQYELLVALVNDMVTQVTMEHREALQQLQKTRQFHENMSDTLNDMTSPVKSPLDNMMSSPTNPLAMFESSSTSSPPVKSPMSQQSRVLSLDDKIRLAKQEEMGQRINTQSTLQPNVTTPVTQKSRPKDLTDTLLANNLNQLNWSTNKTTPVTGTVPNYTSINSSSSFTSPTLNRQQNFMVNQMPQTTPVNWNQQVPNNFGSPKPMQLGTNSNWTSPSMMLPTSSLTSPSSQSQSTLKLSTEEIMDFLK